MSNSAIALPLSFPQMRLENSLESGFAMGQIRGDVTTHNGDEWEGGKIGKKRKEQLPQLLNTSLGCLVKV